MGIKETLGDIWETPLWGAVELLVGWAGGNLLRKWIDNQKPIDQVIITDVIQLIYDILTKVEAQSKTYSTFPRGIERVLKIAMNSLREK